MDGREVIIPSPTLFHYFDPKTVVKISSGKEHVVFLKNDKTVYTFGSSKCGKLGNDSIQPVSYPVHLSFFDDKNVVDILTSPDDTFVLTGKISNFFTKEDKKVYGFGRNNFGQLGVSSCMAQSIPVQIKIFNDKQLKDVSGGEDHILYLCCKDLSFS